jgi:hypothetical protein
MLPVGRQRCGGAVCKVNGASSYSLGSLSDITYDPNSDALRVRYVEVSVKGKLKSKAEVPTLRCQQKKPNTVQVPNRLLTPFDFPIF